MTSYSNQHHPASFAGLWRSFGQPDDGNAFANLLSKETIDDACRKHHVDFATDQGDIWTPALTLWTWLWQCLSGTSSCVAAVARAMVLRIALDLPPCSAHTGAYCKARAKLPLPLIRQLAQDTGQQLEDRAPDSWRWHGRRVLLADGSALSIADTEENRQAFPQGEDHPEGLTYPLIRVVVLLAFATAALIDAAEGPWQGKETGEPALFRRVMGSLRRGDVVVADRCYCSYWLFAWMLERHVDVAFRLHNRRHVEVEIQQGHRLGKGDYLVRWHKPRRWEWMSESDYAALPEAVWVRLVRVQVPRRGYRTKRLWVATTLFNAYRYSKEDIAELYHQRWHVELDLRNLKQTMGLEELRCKTPEMVRKELWSYWLAYNLVRQAMAEAAWRKGVKPRELSFSGAVAMLEAFRWGLVTGNAEGLQALWRALWPAMATHVVGNRPGRVEPRKVKKRRGKYRKLDKPRQAARAALLSGVREGKKR